MITTFYRHIDFAAKYIKFIEKSRKIMDSTFLDGYIRFYGLI